MPENQEPAEKGTTASGDNDNVARPAHHDLGQEAIKAAGQRAPELDDFGLPGKKLRQPSSETGGSNDDRNDGGQVNEDTGREVNDSKERNLTGEQNGRIECRVAEKVPGPDSNDLSRVDATPSKNPDVMPVNPPANERITSSIKPEDMFAYSRGDGLHQATGVSEWSHQQLAPHSLEKEGKNEDEQWQDMPAFAPYDLYDDNGKLVAREAQDSDDEADAYSGLGGAGKGYTRVQIDEDARSATSMDENTSYLFKEKGTNVVDEDEEQRDPLAQMQATKDLLTEGQRIAYVGVTRLAMVQMVKELEDIEGTKGTKKDLRSAIEAMKMWSQKTMVRLYAHMEIDAAGKHFFLGCLM